MVRHVIVFNAVAPHDAVLRMAVQARQVLGGLSGVTDIRFGVAVTEQARYRYYFDIGLVDEAALATYRTDPIHVRFADEEFRPMAPDRVTTDYVLE